MGLRSAELRGITPTLKTPVTWFYLSVCKNLAKGTTEPPEKARELMYAGRRRHIDATHNLYELREAGRQSRQVEIRVCVIVCVCCCDIMYTAVCIHTLCVFTSVCVCVDFSQLVDHP